LTSNANGSFALTLASLGITIYGLGSEMFLGINDYNFYKQAKADGKLVVLFEGKNVTELRAWKKDWTTGNAYVSAEQIVKVKLSLLQN